MSDQIVEFETDIPQQVALLYLNGKQITTHRGPRVMFSLKGGAKMFVDPPVAEQIAALGAAKGEAFSICRRESGFEVKRLDQPTGQPGTPVRAASPAVRQVEDVGPPNNNSIPAQVQYGAAFADFLILAADAVRMAERNSPAGSVRFDNRDVAAIATTMWIAADKAGALVWNGAPQGGR